MKFDENLAAVHGYLCSDGYVIRNPENQRHKYYVIALRNTNIVLLEDFQNRFEKYFGVKPAIRNGRCIINSKPIYIKLIDKFGSFYSYEWKIPELDRNLITFWLRAFFDCEGWVEINGRKSRMVCAESVNLKGLEQVKRSLLTLGIKSRIKPKKSGSIFRLLIFGKENVKQFGSAVGFLHPQKREKLLGLISSYPDYVWSFPCDEEENMIFVKSVMLSKARPKPPYSIRITSNKKENLVKLSEHITKYSGVTPKINSYRNGYGTEYSELSVNNKNDILKLMCCGLIGRQMPKNQNYLFKQSK
jgi:intein/homing endonuclease